MSTKTANTIELEIGSDSNRNLFWAPLQMKLRGRFDLNRVPEPQSKMKINDWSRPIPGQRLGLNLETGEGYIAEPLHEPEHAAIKAKITKLEKAIPPAVQTFPGVHVATWLFWMKRAVEGGLATVVVGGLPDKIDGQPRKSFITQEQPSSTDRLAAAIEKQTEVFAALLDKLTVTPKHN